MKEHFENFAQYNKWANKTLYGAVSELAPNQLTQNLDGFFSSILHTLNHLLVGDLMWMRRLDGGDPDLKQLDAILFTDMPSLQVARSVADDRLQKITQDVTEERLASYLEYTTSKGIKCHDKISEIFTHIFNHQTHHRGQCHHMLSQLGMDPPPLDMIYFVRDRDNNALN